MEIRKDEQLEYAESGKDIKRRAERTARLYPPPNPDGTYPEPQMAVPDGHDRPTYEQMYSPTSLIVQFEQLDLTKRFDQMTSAQKGGKSKGGKPKGFSPGKSKSQQLRKGATSDLKAVSEEHDDSEEEEVARPVGDVEAELPRKAWRLGVITTWCR